MGLFGSLFTGVSGLGAETQSTAMISNNIANVNTIGFKRSEAAFFSLVTTEGAGSEFSPGTVSVNRVQRVDQQGSIQQTSSSTDAAISGNGFFPVKRADLGTQEFLYTRSGSFSEDSQGLLRNSANFILFGWPIDADGNLPANQGDLTALEAVNVAFLGGLTRPTTSAELSINLDATETNINPHLLTPAAELPVNGQPADFTRGLTVFDSLGSSQTISMEFRKITGPMAHFSTNSTLDLEVADEFTDNDGPTAAINAGDEINITVGATTETYTFVDAGSADIANNDVATVQDLITAINAHGGNGLEARLVGGRLTIQAINPTETIIVVEDPNTTNTGSPITGGGTSLNLITDPGADDAAPDYTYEPEASLTVEGTPNPDQNDYPSFANSTTPNTQGWWEMTMIHPDGTELSRGLLNFDGDGSINASEDSDGNIDIELTNVDWGNGSSLQDFNIDISRFSQFAGNYDVIFSDQNGAELGLRTGVEIDREGIVVARFSNGATTDLFKIPLVTFANANGLTEVSGTAYTESEASGEENLREAGEGGAGFLEPSTIEASNVDLADEFAKLIVSQRAFSANTRVINTVDQMTNDLINLR